MRPEIMNHATKCQKVKCVMIDHDPCEKVRSDMDNVINKMKAKFPNTNIVISSLLPRRDRKMEVSQINDYLLDLCDSTRKLTFMNNITITDRMVVDRKHLDDDGFRRLLSNIRFTLFGKIPLFKKRRNFNQDDRVRSFNPKDQHRMENSRY